MAEKGPDKKSVQELNAALQLAATLGKTFGLTLEEVADVQEKILAGQIKSTDQITKTVKRTRDYKTALSTADKEAQKLAKTKTKIADIDEGIKDLADELMQPMKKISTWTDKSLAQDKASIIGKRKQIALALKNGDISQDQAFAYRDQINQLDKTVDLMDTLGSNDELRNSIQAGVQAADDLQGKITGFMDNIPGGAYLAEKLGLDGVGDMLKDGLEEGMIEAASALQAGASPMEALQAGMKGFNSIVAMNPMLLVVAAAAALGALLLANNKAAKDFSDSTGLSLNQSRMQLEQAREAVSTHKTMYATAEDVLAVQKEMVDEFGTTLMMTSEQAASTADIGEAFGYGASQAGKVNAELMKIGASVDEANEIQTFTAALAEASGVAPGPVMDDIAKNAGVAAKYFKGGLKELTKAAVEAAKMGMSLESMTKVADGLLNIEDSLQKQFRAQALTGKQLNFDTARRLALEGDIVGASKEILKQMGSADEFSKMSVVQKKAMADAAGMEVGELEASLRLQEKMAGMDEDAIKAASKLGLSASELEGMSQKDIMNKVDQQRATDKMAATMSNIKSTLANALMPLAEAFGNIMEALMPVFKFIGAAISGFVAPFTAVFKVVSFISDKLTGWMEQLGIMEPIMKVIKGLFAVIGTIILIDILPGALAWAASMLVQAVTTLPSIVSGLIASGTNIVTTILPSVIAWTASVMSQALTAIPAIVSGLAAAAAGMIPLIASALSAAAGFIGSAVGAIFSAFGMIPFGLGIPLAIAAVGGMFAMYKKSQKADDILSPAGGGGGYGKRVLLSPEGTFSLNNKDTVVAGTDLQLGNDMALGPKNSIQAISQADDMVSGPEGSIQSVRVDDVAAGPEGSVQTTSNNNNTGNSEEGYSSMDLQPIIKALEQLITAAQNPPPVVIGEGQVSQMSTITSAAKSFMG